MFGLIGDILEVPMLYFRFVWYEYVSVVMALNDTCNMNMSVWWWRCMIRWPWICQCGDGAVWYGGREYVSVVMALNDTCDMNMSVWWWRCMIRWQWICQCGDGVYDTVAVNMSVWWWRVWYGGREYVSVVMACMIELYGGRALPIANVLSSELSSDMNMTINTDIKVDTGLPIECGILYDTMIISSGAAVNISAESLLSQRMGVEFPIQSRVVW